MCICGYLLLMLACLFSVRLSVGLSVSIIAKFRSTGQCAISSVGRSVCLSVRRSISMQFKKCFSEFRFDHILKLRNSKLELEDHTRLITHKYMQRDM